MARKKNAKVTDTQLTKPQTRLERYLGTIAGLFSNAPTDPRTRLERYLDAIVNGGVPITPDTPTSVEGLLYGNSEGKVEGILPDLTAEEIAARIEAAKLISEYPRPNLLDNAYFVGGGSQLGGGRFPINQQGLTSYINVTYAYTIDRWKFNNNGALNIGQNNISFTNNMEWNDGIAQPHEESFGLIGGRRVTISFLFGDGTFYSETITAPISSQVDWHKSADRPVGFSLCINAPSPATFANGIVVSCGAGETISLKAVKLELGDTQTLAHKDTNGNWVLNEIPNYGEELRKCLRYQWVPSAHTLVYYADNHGMLVGIGNSFPVVMRTTPTMRFINSAAIFADMYSGVETTLSTLPSNIYSTPEKQLFLYGYTPTLPQGEYYMIISDVLFDANL